MNIKLESGEKVRPEQGYDAYASRHKMSVEMNPCCGFYAALSGESCCKNTYVNNNAANLQFIGFTPIFPAKVIPMTLAQGELIRSKPGGYMSEVGEVEYINVKLIVAPEHAAVVD